MSHRTVAIYAQLVVPSFDAETFGWQLGRGCIRADPLVDDALFVEMFGKEATTASAGVAQQPAKLAEPVGEASVSNELEDEPGESEEELSEEGGEEESTCSRSVVGSLSRSSVSLRLARPQAAKSMPPPSSLARSVSSQSLRLGCAGSAASASSTVAPRHAVVKPSKRQAGTLRRVLAAAPAQGAGAGELPESCVSASAWGDMRLHGMSLADDWPNGQLLKALQRARNTINSKVEKMCNIGWYAKAKVGALKASESRWVKHDKIDGATELGRPDRVQAGRLAHPLAAHAPQVPQGVVRRLAASLYC